jgi:DNA-binding beta-propeller fold protein YncE
MRIRQARRAALLVAGCVIASYLGVAGGALSVVSAQQDTWTTDTARRMGIRLAETRDASGPPAYPVQPGDLLFFTNASGSFGAKNTLDAIVVVDAKTRKPIAMSNLEADWAEGYVSHGNTVSPDGRFVYLPGIAPGNGLKGKNPSRLLVLDARTLKIHQIIVSGGERPHHAEVYVDHTGVSRVLIEDFNWIDDSGNGKGFFILDHTNNHKVLGGMLPGEMRGNPYSGFTSPDGRYIYYGSPSPDKRVRGEIYGWLAKVDLQTMKVVQALPMAADPIWTVFSRDGRYAWVSQAGHDGNSKVTKIERATDPKGMDKIVLESPAGPGVYGMALTWDEREIWTADKGEPSP